MQASSTLKHARLSPQKARLVADQIRGLSIEKALYILNYSLKKGAGLVKNTLMAAVANAEHNFGADIDELKVKTIYVDEGPVFKRMHARAKGRGSSILKRTSHITVMVSDS